MRVDLLAHVVELARGETEPLRDVPALPAAHPEHVPVLDDPLVPRRERRIGVRVLGELEDRIHQATFVGGGRLAAP